jgi:hypothetical protein
VVCCSIVNVVVSGYNRMVFFNKKKKQVVLVVVCSLYPFVRKDNPAFTYITPHSNAHFHNKADSY